MPGERALLIQRVTAQHWSIPAAATAAGISRRTAFKRLRRYREQGTAGLADRSSRPRHMPHATPAEWRDLILQLRQVRNRGADPRPAEAAALDGRRGAQAGRPRAPAQPRAARAGAALPARASRRAGPPGRQEARALTGFFGHRITGDRRRRRKEAGWEYVHIAIDDASRLAYVEVLRDERGPTTGDFLRGVCGVSSEWRGCSPAMIIVGKSTGIPPR